MSQRRIEDIIEVVDEFLFVIKSVSNSEREKILSMVHLNMIQDMAYVAKQQPNLESFKDFPDIEARRKIQEIIKLYKI